MVGKLNRGCVYGEAAIQSVLPKKTPRTYKHNEKSLNMANKLIYVWLTRSFFVGRRGSSVGAKVWKIGKHLSKISLETNKSNDELIN